MTDKEYSYRKKKLEEDEPKIVQTWSYYDLMDMMKENEVLKKKIEDVKKLLS